MATGAELGAQDTDVIRGRVTGPDSLPLPDVQVTVTSISGNVKRSARTARDGRFTITFPGGDGDYIVTMNAIGYTPKQFQLKRVADEEILVADARLALVTTLDEVEVSAQREKVRRGDNPPDVSGTERVIESQNAVPAADLGDLAAMAATLPGVQLVPGENGDPNGYSVLGLGADQNNTMLNGMPFGGSSLPRDAAVSTSLVTSPYDVSRGGFSGAQLNVRTRPGTNFSVRGASFNVDAPQTQWTDRTAQALGQQYSNLSLGGVLSGPIATDRTFYNVAYQLGRRSNDLQSLLNTDPLGLQAVGVSSDSVARFLGILNAAQLPVSVAGAPNDRTADQGSIFGAFDFLPPSSTSGHAFNISFNGSWNKQDPAGGFATELPSLLGERTGWRSGVQGRHSAYLFGALSESSLGFNISRTESNPYLRLPAGRVRVTSDFEDGGSAVQMLSFGGSQSLDNEQRTRGIAFQNQLSWFSANNSHRLKLTSELRHESSTDTRSSNLFGTYVYNSLADLEANRPATYTRQLAPRERDASQLVAALSLGDAWRKSNVLQLQYGLRVDANRYLDAPAYNAEVEQLFGRRNDDVPSRLYLSPRVGFSWSYGTGPQVPGFEGAQRGPRAVVRGGIGLFQNVPNTGLIGSALENTGLPDAVQQISCVGAATPVPDWQSYMADPLTVPDRCADGTTGTVFADAAPSVTLFARNFRAPRSVRSNLQWSGGVLDNRLSLQIEGTYSRNLDQTGTFDLNFNPTERFSLSDEDGRPVYVRPTSIVPQTGAIAARDARVSQLYSRVTELRSDLESESRQIRLGLAPTGFSTNFSWNVSYVWSYVREQVRGFSSTAGNPVETEWTRSSMDSRHQIVYNIGYNFFDWVRANWYGSFRSGTPFTPTVAGDINGDGYSNDRAFVFDPSAAGDPEVASAMQSLLEDGSSAARDCLRRQLGRIASRNSCQGPWTSNAVLSLTLNPVKFRMPRRATISFQLSNPLGAADLLINGSDDLRGWGQTPMPDQSLLYVRGFDPQTQRYRYEVNQRFGATSPSTSALRNPVTLTAMMRFDLGPTRERQLLTQQLDRGRRTQGTKAAEPMLRAVYGSGGGLPNPMAAILRQQDSLRLTSAQADSIATMNRWYLIRIDSIWSPVAKHFANLPDRYDHGDAYDRYLSARKATVDLLSQLAPRVKAVISDEQMRKLPAFITSYLEPRYLASIRSGTATFTGGMMPGGMMLPGGAFISQAGAAAAGGGNVTVIRH
ncbi:MAG TPA: TonB-dependent receptor [Gemmatimonadaceae bacterium]|nr:TonB-dependent receptor [Gemmatimonadaceae bacterium]